ncbi:related to PIF1 - DNA helicase involved in mitochondrial DNA repair and telomere length control [Melanopsichium pennsylvanicum]|uniref:ATP-dependent DNA helicase PIF1 n=2 Tax=Melanopsichium pennsylvanicum TaxID=63383 RepID=A0AAJ4XLQ0_9BASI|nr:related to PIF1-DNA helicase involved in mitochondrial DNA repair and telomere length control [Melanopsichium pennsylvanicum 4]SNX84453.1 related to PIF1 - DNA helicase involved in mitochondrial DNA repair and telomere length control [Melanopsichium pennsylvanicum]
MYARNNTSSDPNGQPQVRSALGSLKRTWSGNQHDLGSTSTNAEFKPATTQKSSQEVFYEWSDSPSPPPRRATRSKQGFDSDKENRSNAVPEKKAKSANTTAPRSDFVTASSFVRDQDINTGNTTASASRPTSQQYAQSYSHPSGGNNLATQFSYDRSQARSVPNTSAAGPSRSVATPSASRSSSAYARTSSAPTMSWMKTASQLRNERRNDPSAYQTSSLISSSGRADSGWAHSAAGAANPIDNTKSVNKIFLSQEQRKVLQMVVEESKSVFFTGSAGTGKSVLLREIIKELRRKHARRPDSVAVTASTGIAACNIGGVTVHSFSGIGLGKESTAELTSKIRKNRKAAARWARTQVLIIDEISMVDPALLDKLEEIARLIRKKPDKPFGGIQVVITGDFFQLPPVIPGSNVTFAFDAQCWNKVMQHKVNLTQVFRQKDESFVTMLNEMRFGKLSQKTIDAFKKLERVPTYDEDIVPTELFPRREDVDRANMDRLNALQTESQSYRAQDGGSLVGEARERVLQNSIALPVLHVKKGAQVMLIKNLDETLVNGSVGKVIDFMDDSEYDKQTGALDAMTELSKEDRDKINRPTSARKWPLVRFHLANGQTRDYLTRPETWKTELPDGEIQASRMQVPLILAWAMSIHKSQGQTLPCCKINLNRVFERGQAYVALSRATSLEGLQVIGFRADKVMAHPRVIAWSQSLIAFNDSS